MNDAAGSLLARVERLSPTQRAALGRRLARIDRDAGKAAAARGGQRLVAFIVPATGPVPDAAALREHAAARLPDYMVPQHVVVADALPHTPTGKLDRGALRMPVIDPPKHADTGGIVSPRNAAELILAEIWADVLGFDQISVDDNFFEVGGDSLLSIRILARAGKAGLKISPERFFAEPTIAAQAAAAESSGTAAMTAGPVSGPVPLTPIQRWFFRRIPTDPQHWNQSALYAVHDALTPAQVDSVLTALVRHHDALRIRIDNAGGTYAQRLAAPDEAIALSVVDLSGSQDTQARIAGIANDLNTSLAFGDAPLIRFAWITGAETDRLLIVAHHLVVDAVSWRIVLEDLETLCAQVLANQPATLRRDSSTFGSWAQRLQQYAQEPGIVADLSYWRTPIAVDAHRLPLDEEVDPGNNTVSSASLLSVSLPAAATTALLTEVPQAFRTRIDEILLTALGLALADWTGRKQLLVDTEGHGRDSLFDDLDVSRTVGWLTTVFPVRLDIDPAQALDATVRSVKEQLRAIPKRGMSHGLLRELGVSDVQATLSAQPESQVLFNYLGQIDRLTDSGALFAPLAVNVGSTRSPAGVRAYLLEINAQISGSQLHASFSFSTRFHRPETIARLADGFLARLNALIDTLSDEGTRGFTPSDFPLADLNQGDLDAIADLLGDD